MNYKRNLIDFCPIFFLVLFSFTYPELVYASPCVSPPPYISLQVRIVLIVFIVALITLIVLLGLLIILFIKRQDFEFKKNIVKKIKKVLVFLTMLIVIYLLNNIFTYVIETFVDENSSIRKDQIIPCSYDTQLNHIL